MRYPTWYVLSKCFLSLLIFLNSIAFLDFKSLKNEYFHFYNHFVEKDCLIPTFPRAGAALIPRLHEQGYV